MASRVETLPTALIVVVFSFFECRDAAVLRCVSKSLVSVPEAVPYSVSIHYRWEDEKTPLPPLLIEWCRRVVCLHLVRVSALQRLIGNGVRFPRVRVLKCFTAHYSYLFPSSLFAYFPSITGLYGDTFDLAVIPLSVIDLSFPETSVHNAEGLMPLMNLSLRSFTTNGPIHPTIYHRLLQRWAPTLTFLESHATPISPSYLRHPSGAPLRRLSLTNVDRADHLRYFRDVCAIRDLSIYRTGSIDGNVDNIMVEYDDNIVVEIVNFTCLPSLTALHLSWISTRLVCRVLEMCQPANLRSLRLTLDTYCSDYEWQQFCRFTRLDTFSLRYPPFVVSILSSPLSYSSSSSNIRKLNHFFTLPRERPLLHLDLNLNNEDPPTVLSLIKEITLHCPRLQQFYLHCDVPLPVYHVLEDYLSNMSSLVDFHIFRSGTEIHSYQRLENASHLSCSRRWRMWSLLVAVIAVPLYFLIK